MIPTHDQEGNLPPGIHESTWDEFEKKFGYNIYRKRLLRGMRSALDNLRQAGCSAVYIDGSFVTTKNRPKDYDGCWEQTGVNLDLLDPALKDFNAGCFAQKVKFFGELYPSGANNRPNQTMLEFFQKDRENNEKGIIQINLGES